MTGPLARALSERAPLVLDGAMGTELQRRGVATGLPLWSAGALLEKPDAVLRIHREYLDAGADIITTNTFRTTRRTFARAGLSDRSAVLTRRAVELARRAREESGVAGAFIAGSIAPLEDCYRPDLVPADDRLRDEHTELAGRLADAGADFLLLETMGTIREAYAACAAARATGKEFVASFIVNREGNLYGGDSLPDAIRTLEPLGPAGFSINCVSPRFMTPAVNVAHATTALPLAVYGNIGIPENEQRGWKFTSEISPEEYAAYAGDWLRAGASIIGGCCGTTPEHIRSLAGVLHAERARGRHSKSAQP